MTTAITTKLAFAAALFAMALTGCTTANSNLAAIEPAAFIEPPADSAGAVLPLSEEQELAAAVEPAIEIASASEGEESVEDEAPQEFSLPASSPADS